MSKKKKADWTGEALFKIRLVSSCPVCRDAGLEVQTEHVSNGKVIQNEPMPMFLTGDDATFFIGGNLDGGNLLQGTINFGIRLEFDYKEEDEP